MTSLSPSFRLSKHAESQRAGAAGVVPPPPEPHSSDGPGEMGKPVKVENPDPATKKLIDDGWQKNAFNQYVSDMISVHRNLPDPRDEW
jgi:hypothetical protein